MFFLKKKTILFSIYFSIIIFQDAWEENGIIPISSSLNRWTMVLNTINVITKLAYFPE